MTRHPVRYHCELRQVSSLQKAEQPDNKLPTTSGSHRKQGNSRKTSTSASLTTQKPLTVWITTNCGKFLNRQKYQTTLPASWETCMKGMKQQLELDMKQQSELDMEQQTGSKLGKEYVKAVYCHPAYLIYMQSTSWEILAAWSTSWNQDCQEKYQ